MLVYTKNDNYKNDYISVFEVYYAVVICHFKCLITLMQKWFRLAVNVYCMCCYSCSVLSAIHLDLGCTHLGIWSVLERDWRPKSSSFLYRVQCGSFNHALARLKRWLGCSTHVMLFVHGTVILLFLYALLLSWQHKSLLLLGYHTFQWI